MNIKLAACLLVLALLVGWVLYAVAGGRDGAPRGSGERVAAAQDAEPAPELVSAPAIAEAALPTVVREVARAEAAAAPVSAWRGELAGLSGRVVEGDGLPVPGIRVSLIEVDSSYLFSGALIEDADPSFELEETVTDEEGRFLLGGARGPAFHGLGVDLGGPRATVRVIDHSLPHRERTDVGDVVLAPYGVLTGRVLDDSGAPLSGARVRAGPFPEEILQGTPYEFRSDSLVAVNMTTMGGDGQGVIDLPNWVRKAVDRFPVPTTFSGADGTFRLEGVALASVVGGVDLRGYVGVPIGPVDVSVGEHDLGDLVLSRGRTIRGVVEDSYGEPVAGVEVFAGAEIVPSIAAILQPCGKTDADGNFELVGVPEANQVVAVSRRGPHEAWGAATTARHDNVLIELQATVQLTVNVRDTGGKPLSGARIQLTPAHPLSNGMGFSEVLMVLPKTPTPKGTFREDEAGRYVSQDLGAGLYDITAYVAGVAPGFLQVDCQAELNEVTVICAAGTTLDLQVIDAVSQAPIQGARGSVMRVGRSGFSKLAVESTDEEGRARIGPLPDFSMEEPMPGFMPAGTMLLVQHPRYGDYSADLEPGAATLVVALEAGGTLEGRVHWGGAIPTRLYMLVLEFHGADGFLEVFHMPSFSVTDLAGEFRVPNLTPGKYTLELSERFLNQDPLGLMANDDFDVPTLHREEFEIRNGETAEVVIDLLPSGRGETATIVGSVRVDGRILEGAEVRIRGNESVRVVSDAGGRFETPPFSVRESVHVTIEGEVKLADGEKHRMGLYEESLELEHEDVHRIDLDLYPMTVRVQVVEEGSGQPIEAARVSAKVEGKGGRWNRGNEGDETGSTGEISLPIMQAGTYSLSASASGFGKASTKIEVPAEGLSETTVLKMTRAIACAGRVAVDPGEVVSGGFNYVHVQQKEGSNSAGARLTPPDYEFELDGLAPGEYRAWTYVGARRGAEQSFVLGPDGDRNLIVDYVPAEE